MDSNDKEESASGSNHNGDDNYSGSDEQQQKKNDNHKGTGNKSGGVKYMVQTKVEVADEQDDQQTDSTKKTPCQPQNTTAQQQETYQSHSDEQRSGGSAEDKQQIAEDDVINEASQPQESSQNQQEYKRVYERIQPNLNQPIGSSGRQVSEMITKALIEKLVTTSDQEFLREVQRHKVEVRDVLNQHQFKQNLLFTAIFIIDEEQSIRICSELIRRGVDPNQKDTLKQTPLYYAAREGKLKIIQFLIDQGMSVNEEDMYRQNPIFYAVSNGKIEACKLLHSLGSRHDYIDNNGETPLFYAIKSNRIEVTEWLLNLKCNLFVANNKQQGLVQYAQKFNRNQIKELLIRHGAPVPTSSKDQKKKQREEKTQLKQFEKSSVTSSIVGSSKVNELEKVKEFSLQIRDGESYRPITQDEFQLFALKNPQIAKYFLNEAEIQAIPIPQSTDTSQLYYHWEKAANRMVQSLMKLPSSWIFNQPVDPEKLGIHDYFRIIKRPMDFLTIKTKLKKHDYLMAEHFVQDIKLVFQNCIKYNGNESRAGQMCLEVHSEFANLFRQLKFHFYLCDYTDEATYDVEEAILF